MSTTTIDTNAPVPSAGTPPAWLESWIAGAVQLDGMRASAFAWHPDVRAALVAFPFDCVVRCACDSPTCSRPWFIVAGAARKMGAHPAVVLYVRREPGAELEETCYEHAQLNVVAYRGGLDQATMRTLLQPAGQA